MFTVVTRNANEKQWDSTTYLLECVKLKRVTMANIFENVEQLKLSYTAGENKMVQSFCKIVWQKACHKVKHTLTMRPSNPSAGDLS